ncbi:MAG TPA: hypothetical protein VK154_04020 [Chitinophagales bacterium]|nr:hypothetical protein [Chitinophagales bacterium]
MKKNTPLTILEMLQPIVNNNSDIIEQVKTVELLYHIIDRDPNSNFFFKVVKREAQSNKEFFRLEYKPKSKDSILAFAPLVERAALSDTLNSWIKIIKGYNAIHTVYDDPIIKANQERFEKQFEILDDDAEYAPFDLQQQLFLNEYLETVQVKLVELQDGKSEIEVKELNELKEEAKQIQNDLSKQPKKKIVKALTWLWAKAQKVGLPVIKEIFLTSVKEITKHIISGI